jgi:hypothetical protein
LSVADARGLASGEARRNLELDCGWEQEQRDTKAWVEGRTRAMYDAARKVRATGGSRGPASVSLKARDAAVEAGRHHEQRTPRPSFGGICSVHFEHVEEVSA